MWFKVFLFFSVLGAFDTTSSEMMMDYYESTGEFIKALEEATALYQNTGDLYYLKKMALYASRLGDIQDGIKWAFEYLNKEFDHDVFFLLVRNLRESRDLQKLKGLIKKYSYQNDSLCFYEGYLYYLENDYGRAFPFFERSKPYFSTLPVFVSSYLDLLWKVGKTDLLKEYLDSMKTESPQLKFLRGLYYKLLGEDNSALAIFDRLYEENFRDVGFLKVYMQCLDEAGNYVKADSIVHELMKIMPFSWEIRKLVGLHYLTKEDYASALSEFLIASGLQEGDPDVHYYLSRTLYALGATHDALKEIEKAVKLNPYSKEYAYYHIFLLLAAEKSDEALKHIYLAEYYFGAESYLYYLKAEALKRKEDTLNAFRNYLKALELDSLNLKRYLDLLEYAKFAHIGLDFMDYLSRAIKVARSRVDSTSVANIAMELNEYDFAIDIMEKMLESGCDDPVVYNNLAYALAELGRDLERALDLVENSLKAQPGDYRFIDTKAWVLFKMGRLDEALNLIEEAIQRGGTEDPEVKMHYKVIKEAKGLDNE